MESSATLKNSDAKSSKKTSKSYTTEEVMDYFTRMVVESSKEMTDQE
jgi:hypothetical protein